MVGSFEPAIRQLWVDEDNRLWVAHSRSGVDQPEGVLLTYDVFDSDGAFNEQVEIRCPGDPAEDRLFLLPGGDAVLVRDARGTAIAKGLPEIRLSRRLTDEQGCRQNDLLLRVCPRVEARDQGFARPIAEAKRR